jgi:hypothetical protein
MSAAQHKSFESFLSMVRKCAGSGVITLNDAELILGYSSGVEQYVNELRAAKTSHVKPDRSALLRMAGNIASGVFANPVIANFTVPPGVEATDLMAKFSVLLARAIMTEIDKEQTS